MKPLNTTVEEVLRNAIQSEIDTRAFYQKLAERGANAAVKKKLLDLADVQLVHQVRLERKYKETLGNAPPAPQVPKVEIPWDVSDLDMPKALKMALEHERESESNYRFLAERVPNTELGGLFLELAEMKWKHKVEIQAEYDKSFFDPERFLLDMG